MKKIRWGIAGPGNIANKFAQAVLNTECAELVGVASRSEEKSRAFAQKYGIKHSFSSYEQMASSDEIDAVYISTIHPFHKSCAEIFIKAKKHILCEKPICINEKQATELFKCAKENGVFIMEAMWTRFLPAIKEARSMIERGEIGEVLSITADFCYRETPESSPILFDNSIAGGALLDVGIYSLHLASYLFGNECQCIDAVSQVENGVDLHTVVTLKYENGIIADLSSAIAVHKPENAYIYGTEGYICLPTFYGADKIILHSGDKEETVSLPFIGNGFEEEIIEVCRCINAGKLQSDVLPHSESLAVIKKMDIVRKKIGLKYPLEGEE